MLSLETMALIITGVIVPLLTGAFALWKMIEKKFTDAEKTVDGKFEDVEKERLRLLVDVKAEDKALAEKIRSLEQNTVSKDDHLASQANMNRVLDSITLALRETGATLTSRIDLVLFEVGRKNVTKPN